MMLRRAGALATSFTLHLLLLALVLVASSSSSGGGGASPPPRARSITVFAVPPNDDTAPPGLNPIDATDDDAIRRSRGSQTVSLPEFTLNIAKIADRATLLFPFATPRLSLERFALAPA